MTFTIVLAGILLGPVVNVLVDRLPHHQPLLHWPSCVTCGATRSRATILPVAGWFWARGNCEKCGTPLPRRQVAVDLTLPLVALLLGLRNGDAGQAVLHLAFAAYFIAIVVIDLEHRLVLNRMTLAGLMAAFGIAQAGLGPSVDSALIGAAVGFLFLWIPALLMPGLGMGDVKLAAVIGALVGFPSVFTALTLGVLVGGLAAALLLFSRRIDRRGTMAYAPYLVVGVTVVLFGVVG